MCIYIYIYIYKYRERNAKTDRISPYFFTFNKTGYTFDDVPPLKLGLPFMNF